MKRCAVAVLLLVLSALSLSGCSIYTSEPPPPSGAVGPAPYEPPPPPPPSGSVGPAPYEPPPPPPPPAGAIGPAPRY